LASTERIYQTYAGLSPGPDYIPLLLHIYVSHFYKIKQSKAKVKLQQKDPVKNASVASIRTVKGFVTGNYGLFIKSFTINFTDDGIYGIIQYRSL
jgi:hypothetical protein